MGYHVLTPHRIPPPLPPHSVKRERKTQSLSWSWNRIALNPQKCPSFPHRFCKFLHWRASRSSRFPPLSSMAPPLSRSSLSHPLLRLHLPLKPLISSPPLGPWSPSRAASSAPPATRPSPSRSSDWRLIQSTSAASESRRSTRRTIRITSSRSETSSSLRNVAPLARPRRFWPFRFRREIPSPKQGKLRLGSSGFHWSLSSNSFHRNRNRNRVRLLICSWWFEIIVPSLFSSDYLDVIRWDFRIRLKVFSSLQSDASGFGRNECWCGSNSLISVFSTERERERERTRALSS